MKTAIAILATLVVATGASAQGRGAYYGPFTDAEAQLLSAVWPEIREAADYDDINWAAHGLARAPGSRDVQRAMAANWDEVREARRFEEVDWDRVVGERELQTSREYAGGFETESSSPFNREEAAVMSQVWGQIREAASFDDINWRQLGLSGPPGNREARRLMTTYWGQLRQAARFEDINWPATTGTRSRG